MRDLGKQFSHLIKIQRFFRSFKFHGILYTHKNEFVGLQCKTLDQWKNRKRQLFET
jgi:hypothetical protein